MLVSEALTEIRNKINDRDEVGLDDSELLSYLNEAVQYICGQMIQCGCSDLATEILIETPTATLPSNFSMFCGYYPIKRTGLTIELLDDPPLKIRYFASYGILGESDTMPFNHLGLIQMAIKLACVYANAQQKLDISADKALQQELTQVIASSMGVGMQ